MDGSDVDSDATATGGSGATARLAEIGAGLDFTGTLAGEDVDTGEGDDTGSATTEAGVEDAEGFDGTAGADADEAKGDEGRADAANGASTWTLTAGEGRADGVGAGDGFSSTLANGADGVVGFAFTSPLGATAATAERVVAGDGGTGGLDADGLGGAGREVRDGESAAVGLGRGGGLIIGGAATDGAFRDDAVDRGFD